jgi:hypothetical protein
VRDVDGNVFNYGVIEDQIQDGVFLVSYFAPDNTKLPHKVMFSIECMLHDWEFFDSAKEARAYVGDVSKKPDSAQPLRLVRP